MTPSVVSMPPTKRKRGIRKKGASTRQREIHQGTKPATNPGAMTRKTAEPRIANTFLIMSSHNSCRPSARCIPLPCCLDSTPSSLLSPGLCPWPLAPALRRAARRQQTIVVIVERGRVTQHGFTGRRGALHSVRQLARKPAQQSIGVGVWDMLQLVIGRSFWAGPCPVPVPCLLVSARSTNWS